MSTRIGLISDVHACPAPLEEALVLFEREQVDKVICGGDIAGYNEELEPTIALLIQHHCDTIIGNHDQVYLEKEIDEQSPICSNYLQALPEMLEYTIEEKSIYVVHANPPVSQHGGIKLLDVNGKVIDEQIKYWNHELYDFAYDVLIVGHTHQVFAQQLTDTLVINPGSSVYNHSCAILHLPEMAVDFYALSGKAILKSWNWGMLVREDGG